MPSYSRPSLTVHTADSVNDTLLYNPPDRPTDRKTLHVKYNM